MRDRGELDPGVIVRQAGTAEKLAQVRNAMMGVWEGFNLRSLENLVASRLFLALLITYLLMAALFESFTYPFVIMFAVPLATFGGFVGLRLVHEFIPTQLLDVLTMLGFVILIGVVVNNAILVVHQALNFMRGQGDVEGVEGRQKLEPHRAIAEAVRTRVRPIFMSMLTSCGGMLPLVLFPGAGSELYRGLGSVVVGGLIVSAVFTLVLTPLVMSLVFDFRKLIGSTRI
jgi:HAE1 family hydrophobic/amphiphilic exporter-1